MEAHGYKIGHSIGNGATSSVYRVQRGDRYYAAKKVKLTNSKTIIETTIYSHLCHPYIMSVHQMIQDGDYMYIIMDEGVPLAIHFQSCTYTEVELKIFISQILMAFSYLDTNGVGLWDFHMGNIIIHNGSYKLIDFGDASFEPTKIIHNSTASLCNIILKMITRKDKVGTSVIEHLSFSPECKEVLMKMSSMQHSGVILESPWFKDVNIIYPNRIIQRPISINEESLLYKHIKAISPSDQDDLPRKVARMIKYVHMADSTIIPEKGRLYIDMAYDLATKGSLDYQKYKVDAHHLVKILNYNIYI